MEQPDWAAIKSADATYLAMVAAWCYVVLTFIATGFAFWAGKWAKAAALAAQKQIKVLEDQRALSEPRPVLFLKMTSAPMAQPRFVACIVNYGDDLAFDIKLSDLTFTYKTSAGQQTPSIRFSDILVLKASEELAFSFSEPPAIADVRPEYIGLPGNSLIELFMRKLFDEGERIAKPGNPFRCAVVTLQYRSVRGKHFEQQYELIGTSEGLLTSKPIGSLVSGERTDTTPTV